MAAMGMQFPPGAIDPKRKLRFPDSRQSIKSRFFELDCHKAAVGDQTGQQQPQRCG